MFGDRPRVTLQEWQHKVRPELSYKGFNDHQLDRLEAMFEQSFQSNPAIPDWKPGIDQAALDQTMKYLREHPGASPFDGSQLDLVESEMLKYIHTAT